MTRTEYRSVDARPDFALTGKGGCQCASCLETNSYAEGCFAAWPKGEHVRKEWRGRLPTDKAYSAHVAHSTAGGIDRAIPAFRITPEPHFSQRGLAQAFPTPTALVAAYLARGAVPYTGTNYEGGRVRKERSALSKLADKYRKAA